MQTLRDALDIRCGQKDISWEQPELLAMPLAMLAAHDLAQRDEALAHCVTHQLLQQFHRSALASAGDLQHVHVYVRPGLRYACGGSAARSLWR